MAFLIKFYHFWKIFKNFNILEHDSYIPRTWINYERRAMSGERLSGGFEEPDKIKKSPRHSDRRDILLAILLFH